MSFGLAWVIAVFLELAIFSDTITDKIKRDHVTVNQPVYQKIEQYQAGLAAEIEQRRKSLAALESLYSEELAKAPAVETPEPAQMNELEQQIKALDAQESELRAELRQIQEQIKSYAADMNAEQLGQRINASNSGRAGAGPRYQFAKQQKEVYEQQQAARESEIAQLRAKRDDLRAAQGRVAADATARRDQARAAVQGKRDALQAQVEAARNDLKELEASLLPRVDDFRQKALAASDFQKQKDDPLSRMTAYQELKNDPKDGATITLFSWMTKFLIIFLEIVPGGREAVLLAAERLRGADPGRGRTRAPADSARAGSGRRARSRDRGAHGRDRGEHSTGGAAAKAGTRIRFRRCPKDNRKPDRTGGGGEWTFARSARAREAGQGLNRPTPARRGSRLAAICVSCLVAVRGSPASAFGLFGREAIRGPTAMPQANAAATTKTIPIGLMGCSLPILCRESWFFLKRGAGCTLVELQAAGVPPRPICDFRVTSAIPPRRSVARAVHASARRHRWLRWRSRGRAARSAPCGRLAMTRYACRSAARTAADADRAAHPHGDRSHQHRVAPRCARTAGAATHRTAGRLRLRAAPLGGCPTGSSGGVGISR